MLRGFRFTLKLREESEFSMPNLASVMKDEIARIARREINRETALLKKQSAAYRRDIAELKRTHSDLARRIAFLEKQEKKRIASAPSEKAAEGARFSPKWVKSHRKKLGLSAADYALLVGCSGLTVYNWEQGKSKPRAKQLAALVEVRGLGKREALRRLEMLG